MRNARRGATSMAATSTTGAVLRPTGSSTMDDGLMRAPRNCSRRGALLVVRYKIQRSSARDSARTQRRFVVTRFNRRSASDAAWDRYEECLRHCSISRASTDYCWAVTYSKYIDAGRLSKSVIRTSELLTRATIARLSRIKSNGRIKSSPATGLLIWFGFAVRS